MGKFSNNNLSTIKIPLEQIREETGNVRKVYDWEEIENLAKSIQANGLLNPLTVKPSVMDEYGSGKNVYELICGHRRLRALALLHKQGVDVGLVECCIRTGDSWTLQMIENIQRTDLTAQDKESAIKEMLEKGLSQKQIADLLSKPISYISDIVAGTKVREVAESAGVDTSALKTRALAQLRSIDAEQLPQKVQELAQSGGTNAAATEILRDYKARSEPKEEIGVPEFADDEESGISKLAQEVPADDRFDTIEEKTATTHVSSKPIASKVIAARSYSEKCVTTGELLAELKKMPADTPVCFEDNKQTVTLHFVKFEALNPDFPQHLDAHTAVPYRLVFKKHKDAQ